MEPICFKLYPSLPFRQGNQPGHLRFRGQKIWRFWSILFIFANVYAFRNTKSLKRQSGIFVKIRYFLLFLVFLDLFHAKSNLFIKFVKVFSMKFVPKVYKHKIFVKYLAFFRHVKVSAHKVGRVENIFLTIFLKIDFKCFPSFSLFLFIVNF